MNEDNITAIILDDKAKPLGIIEKLNCTCCHFYYLANYLSTPAPCNTRQDHNSPYLMDMPGSHKGHLNNITRLPVNLAAFYVNPYNETSEHGKKVSPLTTIKLADTIS